jgi:uncharacterized protein (DUF305 family)
MTSRTARIAAVVGAVAAALFVSSCSGQPGNSTDSHTDHATDTPMIAEQPAGFNADDVAFATNMIPHHEQAVELSAMVPDHSTNADVVGLANQISAEQEPEINALRVFLVQWNENPQDNTAGGHETHGAMQGMVDEATMTKLQSLKGAEFDTLWLESMIGHHEGAIAMAKAEVAKGQNIDTKRMAQTMIDAQQAEIDQMKQMLGGG